MIYNVDPVSSLQWLFFFFFGAALNGNWGSEMCVTERAIQCFYEQMIFLPTGAQSDLPPPSPCYHQNDQSSIHLLMKTNTVLSEAAFAPT